HAALPIFPVPGHRPGRAGPLPEPVMAGRTRLANDAREALLAAPAPLMKQFAAEDIWQDLSMREYDVLYTLSKCREPARVGELHRHVLLRPPRPPRGVRRVGGAGLRGASPAPRRWARRPPVAHRVRPGATAPDRPPPCRL